VISTVVLVTFALLVFNRLETAMVSKIRQQFEMDAGSKIDGLRKSLSQTTERFLFSEDIPIFRSIRFHQLTLNRAALSNDIRQLELYFLELQKNDPELKRVRYIDEKGTEILHIEKSSIAQNLADLSHEHDVRKALELTHGEVSVTVLRNDGNEVSELIWWVPVFPSHNVSTGVLGFHISFDALHDRVMSIGKWDKEHIRLEDEEGNALIDSRALRQRDKFQENQWNIEDTLGIPGLSWKIVLSAYPADYLTEVASLRRQVFVIILPGIIVMSFIGIFFITRQIIVRIKGLVRATNIIGSGNLDYKIEVKKKDELGELSVAFNQMTANRKQAEEELSRHQEHLQELVDERTKELEAAQLQLLSKERLATLGQLTSVVSHELRNPLGTVQSSLYIIKSRILDKDLKLKKPLERAERSIRRCNKIIEEMLYYTRERVPDLQVVEFDKWLDELLDELEIPNGIMLTRKLSAGLEISFDPEQLRRCVINVINNACEAMKEKSEPQTEECEGVEDNQLTVETGIVDNRLNVRIIDSGPGITHEKLEKIFEPLYSTKSFGAGLGMSIVKQIIERHKGGIEIKSELLKRTEITLWLPVN